MDDCIGAVGLVTGDLTTGEGLGWLTTNVDETWLGTPTLGWHPNLWMPPTATTMRTITGETATSMTFQSMLMTATMPTAKATNTAAASAAAVMVSTMGTEMTAAVAAMAETAIHDDDNRNADSDVASDVDDASDTNSDHEEVAAVSDDDNNAPNNHNDDFASITVREVG